MSEITYKPVSLQPAIDGQLSPDERIALYKRFVETEEKRILERHREGAGGVEIAEARAELIDKLISTILQATIKSQKLESSPVALVAIGGYGRGTLNPGSDIDLLFLLPRASTKLPKNVQELVQRVLYVALGYGVQGRSVLPIHRRVRGAGAAGPAEFHGADGYPAHLRKRGTLRGPSRPF